MYVCTTSLYIPLLLYVHICTYVCMIAVLQIGIYRYVHIFSLYNLSYAIRTGRLCTYQYYAPLPPSWVMLRKRWGFELCKIQIHHLFCMPVSQIPTFSPPKDEDLWGICLLMFTLLYIYMVSGQIPHAQGKFWCQIKVRSPTFSPI